MTSKELQLTDRDQDRIWSWALAMVLRGDRWTEGTIEDPLAYPQRDKRGNDPGSEPERAEGMTRALIVATERYVYMKEELGGDWDAESGDPLRIGMHWDETGLRMTAHHIG